MRQAAQMGGTQAHCLRRVGDVALGIVQMRLEPSQGAFYAALLIIAVAATACRGRLLAQGNGGGMAANEIGGGVSCSWLVVQELTHHFSAMFQVRCGWPRQGNTQETMGFGEIGKQAW